MGPPLRSKAALLQVASFQKSKAWPVTATWTTELTSAETQKYVPQLFIAPAEMLYAKKGRDVGSCGISYWEDLEKYFTICLQFVYAKQVPHDAVSVRIPAAETI